MNQHVTNHTNNTKYGRTDRKDRGLPVPPQQVLEQFAPDLARSLPATQTAADPPVVPRHAANPNHPFVQFLQSGSKIDNSQIDHIAKIAKIVHSMTTVSTATQPLAREQQLLLQRIMAEHCLTEKDAVQIFEELQVPNASLEEAFQQINRQLTRGFGLEIATTYFWDKTKYHAVINLRKDEVGSGAFEPHFNPHEMALIRLIFRQFVQAAEDQQEDESQNSIRKTTLARRDLINLRGSLEEPYKLDKADKAEHVVQRLVDEGWLRVATGQNRRRESYQLELEIAPRSFLELSMYLSELGLPEDDLPQFLFHRG